MSSKVVQFTYYFTLNPPGTYIYIKFNFPGYLQSFLRNACSILNIASRFPPQEPPVIDHGDQTAVVEGNSDGLPQGFAGINSLASGICVSNFNVFLEHMLWVKLITISSSKTLIVSHRWFR